MSPMNIDMNEALRLTKAGRLAEALSVLQGGATPPDKRSSADRQSRGAAPSAAGSVIDMVAPTQLGGIWTPPALTAAPRTDQDTAATGVGIPDCGQSILDRVGAQKLGLTRAGIRGLDTLPGLKPMAPPTPLPPSARFEERSFTNEAGTRPYKLYIPSSCAGAPVPLVVMLHGCTQSPDDFAAGTRMNELAEEQGFLVAYPEQPATAHSQRCWKWFSAADQQRGRGEPAILAGITRAIMAEFLVDPARVYVAGMSAGGAAAAVMGSEYPDLYAAVGVHSGLACGSASDLPSALSAMKGGGAVRARGGKKIVPTIVFHGDRDRTVHAKNGEQVIAQQFGDDLSSVVTHGLTDSGTAFTRTAYRDEAEHEWLVHFSVTGAGHAWSGGSSAGSYTEQRGPNASREMLRFFAGHAHEIA